LKGQQARYDAMRWYATTPSGKLQTIGVWNLGFGAFDRY
jgi:hypothetical protein